jgi:hypothetical protein
LDKYHIFFTVFLLLSFGLGYLTCRVNYFFSSVKTSIILVRLAQVVSLTLLATGSENYFASRTYRIQSMRKAEVPEKKIKEFDKLFMNEYELYKEKSINQFIEAHKGVFDQLVTFNDWRTAMAFLQKHKNTAFKILRSNND